MSNRGYEILQFSLCDGWINNLYDSNSEPYVFATIEEAIAELQSEFDDWRTEVEHGERSKCDGYDIDSFQIICNTTGIIYSLNLLDGKVIISNKSTAN